MRQVVREEGPPCVPYIVAIQLQLAHPVRYCSRLRRLQTEHREEVRSCVQILWLQHTNLGLPQTMMSTARKNTCGLSTEYSSVCPAREREESVQGERQ